jgi:multicomponent Na+:H+ antiporter subunit G
VSPTSIIAAVLAIGAVAFTLVAVLGLYRLPDLYARAHATSKADTLGTLLGLGAAGVVLGGEGAVKLVLLALFLLATAPTATHAVVRAAHDQGLEPWTRSDEATAERDSDGGVDG